MSDYYDTHEKFSESLDGVTGLVILEKTTIVPGSLKGSVWIGGDEKARFTVGADGTFHPGENTPCPSDYIYFKQCSLNHLTGELEVYSPYKPFDLSLSYQYVRCHKNNTYHVPPVDGELGAGSILHLCQCAKCGRKIAVSIGLFGVSHNAGVWATCADCFKVVPEFRRAHPEESVVMEEMVRKFREGE